VRLLSGDHGATQRIVAGLVPCLAALQVTTIGQDRGRKKIKAAKRARHVPIGPHGKRNKEQPADDLAGPRMQLRHIAFAARIGHRETRHRRPVICPHQRIPDNHRVDRQVRVGDHGLFLVSPALRA
jgi:hypothetical protein